MFFLRNYIASHSKETGTEAQKYASIPHEAHKYASILNVFMEKVVGVFRTFDIFSIFFRIGERTRTNMDEWTNGTKTDNALRIWLL